MPPIVLLAAYATGIVLTQFIASDSLAWHGAIVGMLLLLWLALCRSRWGWLPFLGLLLTAGFLHTSEDLAAPASANHISRFADTSSLILEGRVITTEARAAGGYRLLAEMHKVIKKSESAAVSGTVLLYIKEGELAARPGQIVRLRAELRRPRSFGNPGEFDYPLYLAARGIYVTAYLEQAEELVVLVNHPLQQPASLENLRLKLAAQIQKAVPENSAGLVQSLLLGMRGGISDEQRRILSTSGVAHLFAISGLHFGLLALLLYQIGKWLYSRSLRLLIWCPPQRILPVLLIIPMAAYLFLTGNAWATQRAFLMVSVVALLFARDRRTSPGALLASAALCLLLFNPLALFQPGFQLSFAGVAGILVWLPGWQRPFANLSRLWRWPLLLVLTTAAATMATAPATIWHFHQFAPAGLLTNLLAIPLIAWGAVPVGLASMACIPFSMTLAEGGLWLSAKLVTLAVSIVSSICQWPGLAAIPLYFTGSRLILLLGLLIILLPIGKALRHWLLRLVVVLTTLATAWMIHPQTADFQITAISVGQGDATLVSLADDVHYLIDGGGLPGSSIDPGERLIAPAFGRMGIERLNGIIITHNHPDHTLGLLHILQHFPVESIYFAMEKDDLSPLLQNVLQQRSIAVHPLEEGWTHLQQRAQQTFSLFTPSQKAPDINERSIAVFAGNQTQGVLLTADLGQSGLRQLIAAQTPGRITLLKLPHHGSRHAYPQEYLDWAQPTAAFVSSGHGNSYGFPHQQSIEACTERQIPLFRTDQQGMLIFRHENSQWLGETGKVLEQEVL